MTTLGFSARGSKLKYGEPVSNFGFNFSLRRYTQAGAGSATLSMAFAGARMAEACLRAW